MAAIYYLNMRPIYPIMRKVSQEEKQKTQKEGNVIGLNERCLNSDIGDSVGGKIHPNPKLDLQL